MHLLVKNIKLLNFVVLIIVTFFSFLNILNTKCDSVRERQFFTLSHTLLFLILKTKQKTLTKKFKFVTNKCTHISKTNKCDRNIFKLQRYCTVSLHVSQKNPISEVKKKEKITFPKIQILPRICHLVKQIITYWLLSNFPKKYGFRS